MNDETMSDRLVASLRGAIDGAVSRKMVEVEKEMLALIKDLQERNNDQEGRIAVLERRLAKDA